METFAQGGMGVVYKAQDTKLDPDRCRDAIKFLPWQIAASDDERACMRLAKS
jgi:hypothetical protein